MIFATGTAVLGVTSFSQVLRFLWIPNKSPNIEPQTKKKLLDLHEVLVG